MARITKKTEQKAATKKVARVRKTKTASGQQVKASGQQVKAPRKARSTASGQQALRGQYANKRITITAEGKAANPRGLRGARWEIVKASKNTADFLGKPYTGDDGVERPFTAAKFANFVERGFVELAD